MKLAVLLQDVGFFDPLSFFKTLRGKSKKLTVLLKIIGKRITRILEKIDFVYWCTSKRISIDT